jgi:hypothetical protein
MLLGVSRPPIGKPVTKRVVKRRPSNKPKVVPIKTTTPTVLIDDRAGSKELITLPPLSDCGELCRLSSADCCFTGNGPDGTTIAVGVEVKSILDLIQSMNTGRLQATQVPTMLAEYDHVWFLHYREYTCGRSGELLLSEGRDWRPHYFGDKPMMYGYLEGFLIGLELMGVHVKRVASKEEAAWWIGVLARWYDRKWDAHKSFKVFDNSRQLALPAHLRDDPASQRILARAKFAAQFKGVGYGRAMAVARHFKTVEAMVNRAGDRGGGG